MIDGKLVLAVVPARGGSKGIPLKNLRPVSGVPIVARVGDSVKEVPEIDRAVVSTDHDEIVAVAEAAGLAAPFRRPEAISGDRIGDFDVLNHALTEMERIDARQYDIVLMLQPTSPLRRPEHVSATLKMLVEGDWDAVWTVSETDSKSHPLKQLTVTDGHLGHWDEDGAGIVARQQLEPVYHRNGIAYAMTRECLFEQKTILGARSGALVLKGHFVSIDTEWDIDLVEFLLAREAAKVSGRP
jgi:CMP-N-acetylneuraminic acid synthetase